MAKGQLLYIPKELVDELNKLKVNWGVKSNADGFRRIAEDARVGREIRFSINFGTKRKK